MSAGPAGLQLTYAPIGTEHLAKLKLLNSVLFPIKYQVGGTATSILLQAQPGHLKHVSRCWLSQDQLYKQCILFEHTHGGVRVRSHVLRPAWRYGSWWVPAESAEQAYFNLLF